MRMRAFLTGMATLLCCTLLQAATGVNAPLQWRLEAKDLAVKAMTHMEKKVAGDTEAVMGAKQVKEWFLEEKQLDSVGKLLQKKFNTELPVPEKMKKNQDSVIDAIDKYGVDKLKKLLRSPKVEQLPCPPFWNCPS